MARVAALLLLSGSVLLGLDAGAGSGPGSDSDRGRMELRRVQSLAAQPQYGECWARALEHLDTSCKDMTSDSQNRLALRFTVCHLSSSGRDLPSCPEGSEVSRCTAAMDPVAFNAFTEFFTHTHAICHYLYSEALQRRAQNTMDRLTETSAGVAEQLQHSRQMATELMEAQSAALQAQQEILSNGEQLQVILRDSTQGLQAVLSDLGGASRAQQLVLSKLFDRVSFLLMEAHSLTSCCYNAAALCTVFLITSTRRSSRARLVLLALVCLNFYLERKIYQAVLSSTHPEHLHMELVCVYVGVLRWVMVCVGLCVLLLVCVSYKDPVQQSLQVLQQLRDMQTSMQEALQRAESLTQQQEEQQVQKEEEQQQGSRLYVKSQSESRRAENQRKTKKEEDRSNLTHLLHVCPPAEYTGQTRDGRRISHDAPGQRTEYPCSPASPLVYSVLVEDEPTRYRLRTRRSDVR